MSSTTDQPTERRAAQSRANGPRPGFFRYSAVELLVTLVLLIVSSPIVEDLPGGDLIEAGLVTLVMVFSVLAVGGRRRSMLIALLLVTPAVVGKWVNHFSHTGLSAVIYLVAAIAFFAFVVAHFVRFILRAPKVDANVLCAGLSGYLLLGLLFIPAYVAAARLNPAAFTMPAGATMEGFNAFYFSFITLCTVGYGDVTPASKMARMLAVVEAIAGLFYVAVLISRLVAIYTSAPPATDADEEAKS
jgi:hypothetical protein